MVRIYFFSVLIFFSAKLQERIQCYEIKPGTALFDGSEVKPGDTICFLPGNWRNIRLKNIHGTAEKPVVVLNYKGPVTIGNNDFYYAIVFENSTHFHLTGTGDHRTTYGLKITGTQRGSGIGFTLCSDFEVDHLEIMNTGFAGMSVKTDPTCDPKTWRGNFVMTNISIHDNYIHDTGGEGMYIGSNKVNVKCANEIISVIPHEIQHLKVYNNKVENTGWDGLQVSQGSADCQIFSNTITNYGVAKRNFQDCGLVVGGGTTGKVFNNRIINGTGPGISIFGMGENYIYNNLIHGAGTDGIFINDRQTVKSGWGFHIVHNNIINPKRDGIRMYSDESKGNEFCNNVIINPGSYAQYESLVNFGTNDSFIFIIKDRPIDYVASNNYLERDINKAGFVDVASLNFNLSKDSPLLNKGKDFTRYGIISDFNNNERFSGKNPDIGMFEYQER
jgi:hypothetical protein